jgi:hypothetical protein
MISPSRTGIGNVTLRTLAPSLKEGGTFAYFQGDLAKCPKPDSIASVLPPLTVAVAVSGEAVTV